MLSQTALDSRLRGNDGIGTFVIPALSRDPGGGVLSQTAPDSRLRGNDGIGTFVIPALSRDPGMRSAEPDRTGFPPSRE
ncbi:hypothetical protein [Microbulbifer aggregans]|uniref:hypothetical protein n=1 Tax=Microbulbifer aggregans TaxID=1769779 RepID=UPI001CFEF200|nr:hypothetical protein [Microbulbifer aggregans]